MRSHIAAMLAGSSLLAFASPVFAQSNEANSTEDDAIVVTGTIIRGVAPAGANVVGFSEAEIESSGATTMNELLATLPQINESMANGLGQITLANQIGGVNLIQPVQRAGLRNLPGGNNGGANQTLMLMDGHRVVPVGIERTTSDSSMVSPLILQRLEAITDGGSAVYGSDAVAGVLNYITRSSYDGVEANARMSFGQGGYQAWNTDLAAGRDWGSGSAFATYSYGERDEVFGRDLDYVGDYGRNPLDGSALPTSGSCVIPSIRATDQNGLVLNPTSYPQYSFPMPGQPTPIRYQGQQRCDNTGFAPYLAQEYTYGFNAGLTQELTESLTFDVRAVVSHRITVGHPGPYAGEVTMQSSSPYYQAQPGQVGTPAHNIQFSYLPALDLGTQKNNTQVDLWQITPGLTWEIGNDWQLRGIVSYGESETMANARVMLGGTGTIAANVDSTLANAGLINPYNVALSDQAALASLFRNNEAEGQFDFRNLRLIADGPLFALPGGEIRMAAGYEHIQTDYRFHKTTLRQSGADPTLASSFEYGFLPWQSYRQEVDSVFGQISIPIVGEGNAVPFIHSLQLLASARYDNYNDFGDTVNPMVGISYSPVEWLSFNANWGQSFQAPSPTDQLQALTPATVTGTENATGPNNVAVGDDNYVLTLSGANAAPMEPQTSENWSIGFEMRPPIVPGLTLSASYYSIELFGRISNPCLGTPIATCNTLFPQHVYDNSEVTDALLAELRPYTSADLDLYSADGAGGTFNVAAIVDNRGRNLGYNLVEGIDFSASYSHDTDWGSFDMRIGGSYEMTDDERTAPQNAMINRNQTRQGTNVGAKTEVLRLNGSIGVTVDDFRAQASFNRVDGRDNAFFVGPLATGVDPQYVIYQRDVDPFITVDLYFRYNLDNADWGGSWTDDASISLGIDNVANQEPDITQTGTNGIAGTTSAGGYSVVNLGRVFTFGINKRF